MVIISILIQNEYTDHLHYDWNAVNMNIRKETAIIACRSCGGIAGKLKIIKKLLENIKSSVEDHLKINVKKDNSFQIFQ